MARYVLSHRRAGKFQATEKRASREAAEMAFVGLFEAGSDVVGRMAPADELAREVIVFEASSAEVAAKAALVGPDVLVEPEILHYPTTPTLPLDLAPARPGLVPGAVLAGTGAKLSVTVRGSNKAVNGADVILFLRGPQNRQNSLTATTDKTGKASFDFSESWIPSAMLVDPAGDFWSMIVRGPAGQVAVDLVPLPQTGRLAWWHTILGVTAASNDLGKGVSVGVIDTGAGPHPHLDHVKRVGAFIDGSHDATAAATSDVDSHGSHVSGTIGGKPPKTSKRSAGLAPGTSLFAARVFAGPDKGASQADIANAIDHLSREQHVDLINMSLGAADQSQIEHDAILDAVERGTLCVCASGNSAAAVMFPAAFPESVAISALGLSGWGPPGSLSSIRVPEAPDRFGDRNLYFANFSCFGPQTDAAAPGVGIIATVPKRFGLTQPYAAMDGTSMASPAACGALAAVLSKTPDYLALPRNITRSDRARAVLAQVCVSIGLASKLQGQGVPSVAITPQT